MLGVVVLLVSVVGYLYFRWKQTVHSKAGEIVQKYPGPPSDPIFGNALQFKSDPAELCQQVIDWYAQYGSPMKIFFGPFCAVHLFKAQHVEAVLKSMSNLSKSRDYDMVSDWLGQGLLISTGEKWHSRRKLLTPAFHYQILKEFVGVFDRESRRLVEILRRDVYPGHTLDISKHVSLCALDIICDSAMGKKIGAQEAENSEYVTAIAEFSEILLKRAMQPWMWPDFIFYYLTRSGWRMRGIIRTLHSFTNSVIAERILERRTNKAETTQTHQDLKPNKKAFLDLLLDMGDEGKLTKQDIREEVDTFMFEGHDTTATGLKWACYCLGRHPDVQQKVRDEIYSIIGEEDRELTYEDLVQMRYLESVIKEAQRLYPSVPIMVRKIEEPVKIGQKFAMLEEKTVLCNLIRNFRLTAVQEPEEMAPAILLIYRPTKGVLLKLEAID